MLLKKNFPIIAGMLPPYPGNYCFASRKTGEVLYFGTTSCLRGRICQHPIFEIFTKDDLILTYEHIETTRERFELEQIAIEQLSPVWNGKLHGNSQTRKPSKNLFQRWLSGKDPTFYSNSFVRVKRIVPRVCRGSNPNHKRATAECFAS